MNPASRATSGSVAASISPRTGQLLVDPALSSGSKPPRLVDLVPRRLQVRQARHDDAPRRVRRAGAANEEVSRFGGSASTPGPNWSTSWL